MRGYILLLLTAIFFASAACEDDKTPDSGSLNDIDRQFLLAAADDALFQVNAGKVAAAGATEDKIGEYGDEMTKNHTQAGQELQRLAAARDLNLPTTLSDDRQLQLDSLSGNSGVTLDTLYVKQMISAQERAVHMMEIQSTSGHDAELKQWATGRLPVMQQFAERAKAMRDSVN